MNWEDRITPEKITELAPNEVFVFGSNLAGRHGKGAAKDALRFGAMLGISVGLCGKTYAIPTKDRNIKTLQLDSVCQYVYSFLFHAKCTPEATYLVTPVGTGLANYTPEEIAPLFQAAINIPNIHLPKSFWQVLLREDEEMIKLLK